MKSKKQNSTEYTPTTKEKALLEVLLNPNHRNKSKTKICELAGCTRNIYYNAFAKPEFVEYYKSMCKSLIEEALAPTVNAFIQEAKRGSYTHGKIILEMAGLHTDKLQVEEKQTVVVGDIDD